MQKFAIVDIETNGAANRITDIAVLVYDGEKITDEFQSLVNPGGRIPSFITSLTGITEEMLWDAPRFDEIADKIDAITRDCVFVAHSVNFDYNIVKSEFRNFGINYQRKKLCSVRLTRKILPGHRSYSLGNICGELGICINGRHRAYGDAKATLELIMHLQRQENFQQNLDHFLNARSQESTLPSHLDKNEFDRLPNSPGIYYFLNDQYKLIYVGKAVNIRKRVLSHFYSKSRIKFTMLREIAHVDFELAGTEVMALLMEDAAIKKNFPKYNKASKDRVKGFALVSYFNRKGILTLGIQDAKKAIQPLKIFYSQLEARMFIENLVSEYHLCPKYCQLLESVESCTDSIYYCCEGICTENEDIQTYNSKVESALEFVRNDLPDGVIRLKGRNHNEDAFIRMKSGKYSGYGFIDRNLEFSMHELDDHIISQPDNMNVRQILKNYLHKLEPLNIET